MCTDERAGGPRDDHRVQPRTEDDVRVRPPRRGGPGPLRQVIFHLHFFHELYSRASQLSDFISC